MKEHSNLYTLVVNCKQGSEIDYIEIVRMFNPILKKFAFKLDYFDAYDELKEAFNYCIYKMPIENKKFDINDGVIISYIEKSINNQYIHLNKSHEKFINSTIQNEDIIDTYCSDDSSSHKISEILLFMDLKKLLSNKDYFIVIQKIYFGLSDSDIAKIFGVSRQAINKHILKIKQILKNYYKLEPI